MFNTLNFELSPKVHSFKMMFPFSIVDRLEKEFDEAALNEIIKLADIKGDGFIHYEKFINKIFNKLEKKKD